MELLKHFKWSLLLTALGLVAAYLYAGTMGAVAVVAILIVLEMVLSFDNAAINAKYVEKLSPFWQKIFLTVGILVAVVGMRLVFPFAVVSIAGGITPWKAWELAMEKGSIDDPGTYAYILHHAHPMIAAFGGTFLLMLFLNFIFDEEKDSHWLRWIERPLAKAGHFDSMSILVAGTSLIAATHFLAPEKSQFSVLFAGFSGLLIYILTNSFATFMEDRQEAMEAAQEGDGTGKLIGKAAFSTFLFLEVLDASFSFDGVLGAFAITTDPIIIAIGLGVGAIYVRSMTIYLVEKGTLSEIRFLEHGAHWAIGTLAVMLLITIKYEIPDVIIGLSGLVFIIASVIMSKRVNKAELGEVDGDEHDPVGIHASH